MRNYPRTKRDLTKRMNEKTEADRVIARKFGKEFFYVIEKLDMGGSIIIVGFGNQLFQISLSTII